MLQLGFGNAEDNAVGATDRPDPLSDIIENASRPGTQIVDPAVPLVPVSTGSAQAIAAVATGTDGAVRAQRSIGLQSLLNDTSTATDVEATTAAAATAAAAVSDSVDSGMTAPGGAVPDADAASAIDDLTPLANAMNDLPLPVVPKLRGAVTVPRQAMVVPVQAAPASQPTPSSTVNILGTETAALTRGSVRGSATTVVAIDPASGQPTTPQAPSLTGAAVVAPFGIQLGALRSEQQADALWLRLTQKFPGLLGSLSHRVVSYDSGARGVFYRLQAGPMPTKSTAQDFCVQLKRQGQDCIFVRGQS